jgi:hypothetical protein
LLHEVISEQPAPTDNESISNEADLSHSLTNLLSEPRSLESQHHDPSSLRGDKGDSGYGSISDTGRTKRSREEDDAISIKTMLSDASLVFRLPEQRENLIAAFVKDFHEDTNILDRSEEARARTSSHLSGLLKMFSLRLEASAHSQKERDAKDFIRQQREYV